MIRRTFRTFIDAPRFFHSTGNTIVQKKYVAAEGRGGIKIDKGLKRWSEAEEEEM
jgi:hypothetical protein